jgi:predicted Zn finger-like uncharacterized protein
MVITVECPSCASTFPVDPNKVPEGGVYARCSRCPGIFLVEQPAPALAMAESAEFLEGPTHATNFDKDDPWSENDPSLEKESTVGVDEPTIDLADDASLPPLDLIQPDEPIERHTPHAAIADTPSFDLPTFDAPPEPAAPIVEAPPEPAVPATQVSSEPSFDIAPPEPAAPAAAEWTPPSQETAPPPAFTFGRRDPNEKAKRLARVLVSDMVMYNAERHNRAVANGSIREDFEDEIKKSWHEYVDQVGDAVARSTSYFDDALNEILARGQKLFP